MRDESDIIYGRWPIREALEAGPVSKIFIAEDSRGKPIDEIVSLARSKSVAVQWIDRRRLETMVGPDVVHQGVAALVSPMRFAPIETVWEAAKSYKGNGPCLLLLDGIMDPHNFGSLLRSAVFFGVPGVVVPKWRAASLSSSVVRSSAGAARSIPIAQVANLVNVIQDARKRGIWIVGADMDGDDIKKMDVPRPFLLVMGSEGEGLHQLVRKKCDLVASIPKTGQKGIDSLNVGVAGGILMQQFS